MAHMAQKIGFEKTEVQTGMSLAGPSDWVRPASLTIMVYVATSAVNLYVVPIIYAAVT